MSQQRGFLLKRRSQSIAASSFIFFLLYGSITEHGLRTHPSLGEDREPRDRAWAWAQGLLVLPSWQDSATCEQPWLLVSDGRAANDLGLRQWHQPLRHSGSLCSRQVRVFSHGNSGAATAPRAELELCCLWLSSQEGSRMHLPLCTLF